MRHDLFYKLLLSRFCSNNCNNVCVYFFIYIHFFIDNKYSKEVVNNTSEYNNKMPVPSTSIISFKCGKIEFINNRLVAVLDVTKFVITIIKSQF